MTVSTHPHVHMIEPWTSAWWHPLLWGIASFILGLSLIMQPGISALLLVTGMAIFWLIGGVVELIAAVVQRGEGWGWRLAGGVIGILAALYVLGYPVLGTMIAMTTLYVVIAVSALMSGIIGLFWMHGSLGRIVLSLLQIMVGILLLTRPLDLIALTVLVQALGILLFAGGVAMAFVGGRAAVLVKERVA